MLHKPCFLHEESRPIGMEHRDAIDAMLRKYPPQGSEMTFTNFLMWSELRHILFCEHEGHILLSFRDEQGRFSLFPPMGPDPAGFMAREIEGVRHAHWARVPEDLANAVRGARSHHDPDHDDYVYSITELRTLAGKKYDGKRNFIKRFEKMEPTVRTLMREDIPAMLRIQEQWLAGKEGDPGARDESTTVEKALLHMDELPLHVLGVFVSGELVAFAAGEPLNRDTFVEHFEKAVPDLTGVYPYLLHAFAKSIPEPFLYLNREQDLGVPGIRKAKESWQPVTMVRKYSVEGKCG